MSGVGIDLIACSESVWQCLYPLRGKSIEKFIKKRLPVTDAVIVPQFKDRLVDNNNPIKYQ